MLLQNGHLSVTELASRFEISTSTIRRDLAALSGQGRILRTYGGALDVATTEQGVAERTRQAVREKHAIGRAAAEHVHEGDFLFLDAGTTVGALAKSLAGAMPVTVVTNGITSLRALLPSQHIQTLFVGGLIRHLSQGTVGPFAEQMVGSLTATSVFLSADGVVGHLGLCERAPEQIALKRLMVERSENVFVLADSSKLGRRDESHVWLRIGRPWTLITDDGATSDQLAPFYGDPLVTVELVAVVHPAGD
jgi:DeoR/GlpR family transcriptional regulator of sugar metabolism